MNITWDTIPHRIHFIGIDGISMSGIATILQSRGHFISGSDYKTSPPTQRLIKRGTLYLNGQSANNIEIAKPDMVIYTAAIKMDNIELVTARERGIPTVDRATFLGLMTREYKQSIGVAGSHGKTTTTAMLAQCLQYADADPTALVGGELAAINGNVRVGQSQVFLTEACEYVESFLKLNPYIGLILNVDMDHGDYFRDLDHVISAFAKFASVINPEGTLIIGEEAAKLEIIRNNSSAKLVTFGIGEHAVWQASHIQLSSGRSSFTAHKEGVPQLNVQLQIPGVHNVLNALACIATCDVLQLNLFPVASALADYGGTHRRFEIKGHSKGALIVDDYAHHPREIEATLQAARTYNPQHIVVVFQPHTYTRTLNFLDDFAHSLKSADVVIITDIYPAREPDIYGVHSRDLVDALKSLKHPAAHYARTFTEAANLAYALMQPDDLVFSMGAGPVDEVADLLLKKSATGKEDRC